MQLYLPLLLILSLSQLTKSSFFSHKKKDLLVTTAFWTVVSKLGGEKNTSEHYSSRFQIFLNLGINFAFYGDTSIMQVTNNFKSRLVLSVKANVSDFGPCKSHWTELKANENKYISVVHVPSADLGCIWLAKIDLLQYSASQLPEYNWHLWLDIGIHSSHDISSTRFPNLARLSFLPKNKLIVSNSYKKCNIDYYKQQYFQYDHCISGTSYLVHKSFINKLRTKFHDTFEKCLEVHRARNATNYFSCFSDQVILSHLNPNLLFVINSKVDEKGAYGAVAYDLLS